MWMPRLCIMALIKKLRKFIRVYPGNFAEPASFFVFFLTMIYTEVIPWVL